MTTQDEIGNSSGSSTQVKRVSPMTMDDHGSENPMSLERAAYVVERPPVGTNLHTGEPIDPNFPNTTSNPPGPGEEDPAVINQQRDGSAPSLGVPGTPKTEDPATGFETGTTSPATEEKREAQVAADEKAAKEQAKAEKAAAKEETKSETKSESNASKP